jgi:hypothetical protein
MGLNITGYVDPGSYQAEVVVPGGASSSSQALSVGIIGTGLNTKPVNNEAIVRGKITGEAIASWDVTHSHATNNRALRKSAALTVNADGSALDPLLWSFGQPKIISSQVGPFNLTTYNKITIGLDGRAPLTIMFDLTPGSPASSTGLDGIIHVPYGASGASNTSKQEVAAGIQLAFNYASQSSNNVNTYTVTGSSYSYVSVATVDGTDGKIHITSPLTDSTADVAWYYGTDSAHDIIRGNGITPIISFLNTYSTADEYGGTHAYTTITLSGTPTVGVVYTTDYVAVDVLFDALSNASAVTPLGAITRVGAYPNATTYPVNVYSSNNNTILWDAGSGTTNWTSATLSSVAASGGNFTVTGTGHIVISIDNKPQLDIIIGTGSQSIATVVGIINNKFAASNLYGQLYGNVAVANGSSGITIDSPTNGLNRSSIEILCNDTSAYLFGTPSTGIVSYGGTGLRPDAGATYYVSYTYARADIEYNLPKQYFSHDAVVADIGAVSPTNPLAIASQIAFTNNAPSVTIVQVDDRTSHGNPSQAAISKAIAACESKTGITEFVVLDTRSGSMSNLFNFVNSFNGPTIKHPCRAWYGMGTTGNVGVIPVGDASTPGSYVYTATTALKTAADSPGRGRHVLIAPSKADVQLQLASGTTYTKTVDGSYLAVAAAAKYASRTSPSQSMVNATLAGFVNVSDDVLTNTFPTFVRQERALLSGNGVFVLTGRAGNIIALDPVTTERGGGKMAEFEEPQASNMKDDVVTAINTTVDGNLVGVVPSDLADFITSIKIYISNVIRAKISAGVIGPYRDSTGRSRDIDTSKDMIVYQSPTDPRVFNFKYYFNLRYPAMRFYGEYSVDNAFFQS